MISNETEKTCAQLRKTVANCLYSPIIYRLLLFIYKLAQQRSTAIYLFTDRLNSILFTRDDRESTKGRAAAAAATARCTQRKNVHKFKLKIMTAAVPVAYMKWTLLYI